MGHLLVNCSDLSDEIHGDNRQCCFHHKVFLGGRQQGEVIPKVSKAHSVRAREQNFAIELIGKEINARADTVIAGTGGK